MTRSLARSGGGVSTITRSSGARSGSFGVNPPIPRRKRSALGNGRRGPRSNSTHRGPSDASGRGLQFIQEEGLARSVDQNPLAFDDDASVPQNGDLGKSRLDLQPFRDHPHDRLELFGLFPENMHQLGQAFDLGFQARLPEAGNLLERVP